MTEIKIVEMESVAQRIETEMERRTRELRETGDTSCACPYCGYGFMLSESED